LFQGVKPFHAGSIYVSTAVSALNNPNIHIRITPQLAGSVNDSYII